MTKFELLENLPTEPQDILEPPFARLYYYVSKKETQDVVAKEGDSPTAATPSNNVTYTAIALTTDETQGYSEIAPLKEKFAKQARAFAVESNIVTTHGKPLNADERSIGRMGAITTILLYKFAEQAAKVSEPLAAVFNKVFEQTTTFKCADNTVRNVTGKEIAEAHERALLEMSAKWFYGKTPEVKEDSAETQDVVASNANEVSAKQPTNNSSGEAATNVDGVATGTSSPRNDDSATPRNDEGGGNNT